MQLLGPTVFLKSVSINIIMLCSRHHWIFYCNVPQNITPTLNATQRKSHRLTETFYFDWKVFVRSVLSLQVLVFLLCFPFLCFRKSARPLFDKVTEGILFLVRHLLLTLSRNRPRYVCILHLILQSSSQENHVQAGRLNRLMKQPHCIQLWHVCCRWRMALLSQKHVRTLECSDHTSYFILSPSYVALQLICFLNDHQSCFYFCPMYLSVSLFSVFSHSVQESKVL